MTGFELSAADTLGPLADSAMRESFVSPEDCAKRIGVTVGQIKRLVKRGVLRADRWGNVQPANLSGAIDDI